MTFQPIRFVLALLLGGCTELEPQAPALAVGEIWQYETRAGEENSTVTVLKLEEVDDFKVVILRVDDVVLKHYEKGTMTMVPFLPFQRQELAASLTTRVGMIEEIPDFSQQYEAWREAGDKRWIWRKSVPHALNGLQDAYDRLMPKSSDKGLPQTLDAAPASAPPEEGAASSAAEL